MPTFFFKNNTNLRRPGSSRYCFHITRCEGDRFNPHGWHQEICYYGSDCSSLNQVYTLFKMPVREKLKKKLELLHRKNLLSSNLKKNNQILKRLFASFKILNFIWSLHHDKNNSLLVARLFFVLYQSSKLCFASTCKHDCTLRTVKKTNSFFGHHYHTISKSVISLSLSIYLLLWTILQKF